jgi:toxin ParE1/3/4
MYKLIIKPFAESDAEKSAIWYHNVRDGLGNEFLMALQVKLNAIQRDPDLFPVIYKSIRRALTQRFPFGIFYIFEGSTIYVLAILHTSRSPAVWKKRKK